MEKKDFINKTLSVLGFTELNKMQLSSIDEFARDNDYILLSATGSGKTLAFLLPLCEKLNEEKLKDSESKKGALIIAPARELALQIQSVMTSLKSGLTSVCCYGGNDISKERLQLANLPDIIIATPGRLLDHMENSDLDTSRIEYLILDEFDKSLEFGFTEEMEKIISKLSGLKKTVLTSATQAIDVPEYLKLNNCQTIDFIKETQNKGAISINKVCSPVADKLQSLYELICTIGEGQKIVFCNYRESVERIASFLKKKNVEVVAFHGGLEQIIREKSIAKFRNHSVEVLVSTDLAARGLDIDDINHIIHYHIPAEEETYVHRNGRTARMNKTGNSYLILGPEEYMPSYISEDVPFFKIPEELQIGRASCRERVYVLV